MSSSNNNKRSRDDNDQLPLEPAQTTVRVKKEETLYDSSSVAIEENEQNTGIPVNNDNSSTSVKPEEHSNGNPAVAVQDKIHSPSAEAMIPANNDDDIEPNLDTIAALILRGLPADDQHTVLASVQTLNSHMERTPNFLDQASRLGAPLALNQVLHKWKANEDIQAVALFCAAGLCCSSTGATAMATTMTFLSLGGMERAMVALKAYPDSKKVQTPGIWLLMALFDAPMAEAAENLKRFAFRFVMELGGVKLIVATMASRINDEVECIQQCGCQILRSILLMRFTNCEIKEQVIQQGGATAVIRALEKHKVGPVKEHGSTVMKLLFV